MMGWSCQNCPWTDPSDNINAPAEHLFAQPDHEVEPSAGTALRWGRAGLG